jgi:trimethylamine:corrinoid methyltransferase-like protein
MTNNKRLAQIVAERLYDRFEDQMMDAVQEITTDVLEEYGIELDDDGWDTAMDVAGRIYIGAQ